MEAGSYPTVIKSNSSSEIFKADGKVFPVPISGTVGIMHNYMLLIFFLEQEQLRTEIRPKIYLSSVPSLTVAKWRCPRKTCDTSLLYSSSFQLFAVQRVPDQTLVSMCLVALNGFLFHEFLAILP